MDTIKIDKRNTVIVTLSLPIHCNPDALECLTEKAGGCTGVHAMGAWHSNDGAKYCESTFRYEWYFHEDPKQLIILTIAALLRDNPDEQCIIFTTQDGGETATYTGVRA